MRRSLIPTLSAIAVLALAATLSGPTAAQEESAGMFGSGPDRICNTLIDSKSDSVLRSSGDSVVITNHTYDCPEPVVAAVAPAAPPPAPLPESGVLYFGFDKYNLDPEAQAALDDIIFDIKDRQLGGIVVDGFTDTAGSAEYNLKLSQLRANTVASELIKAGIPAGIITSQGFGQNDLAVATPDGVANAANRRVQIHFKR